MQIGKKKNSEVSNKSSILIYHLRNIYNNPNGKMSKGNDHLIHIIYNKHIKKVSILLINREMHM